MGIILEGKLVGSVVGVLNGVRDGSTEGLTEEHALGIELGELLGKAIGKQELGLVVGTVVLNCAFLAPVFFIFTDGEDVDLDEGETEGFLGFEYVQFVVGKIHIPLRHEAPGAQQGKLSPPGEFPQPQVI